VIEPYTDSTIAHEIRQSIKDQEAILKTLREAVRPLRGDTRRIQPRVATSISIVGADGGNSQIQFDPFLVQVIRVVDSNEQHHCLEVVTPNSDLTRLVSRHFDSEGRGISPLGKMMRLLDTRTLDALSVMIPSPPRTLKPSWVQVYRELQEWAVLLDFVREGNFASDTLIMRDGWLRTKVFASDLFRRYRQTLEEAIVAQFRKGRRRIYVAGVLKRSKVLQKYQLAMMLEGVLRNAYPCYVRVPVLLQREVFRWAEIVGTAAGEGELSDTANMVAGEMFFVKFGTRAHDPIWAVDLLSSQVDEAATTLSYMLADAEQGFPLPFFPMCLQRAHDLASISELDTFFLQDHVSAAIRDTLGKQGPLVDEFELLEQDAAG
jgi:hypothetical protein